MTTHLASASPPLQNSNRVGLRTNLHPHSSFLRGPRRLSKHIKECSCTFSVKPSAKLYNARSAVTCSINMAAGQSDGGRNINLENLMEKARKLWESSPQPVKSFPWNEALENFILLVLELVVAVVKYLCVPLFAVSSLSEMSYCAHEKKLFMVPFPLLIGFSVAGILRETALRLSPLLKDAEVPWHLIAIAIFFTLLKLPGPYYPYWGRIFIPHFANGGLWRTLWFSFLWFRRPQKTLKATSPEQSIDAKSSSL